MVTSKGTFAQQVKDALNHLYDVTQLPRLELTHRLTQAEQLNWDGRAQRVRRILLQAIERLDPGDAFPFHARERRS